MKILVSILDKVLSVYIAYKLPAAQLLPLWVQNSALFVQITFFLYGK